MKGNVKFFNEGRGYGFIAGEDGKEYFVHQTGLKEGTRINEGDSVEFDVEQGDKGPKAVNVSMASGEAEKPEEQAEEPAEEEKSEEEPAEEEPKEDSEEEQPEEPEKKEE